MKGWGLEAGGRGSGVGVGGWGLGVWVRGAANNRRPCCWPCPARRRRRGCAHSRDSPETSASFPDPAIVRPRLE